MGKHPNNAIIITSVQGERGLPGFIGPTGQACYTGTGDPNTLGLTAPTYNDPNEFDRDDEIFYYQDTVTGEVWSTTLIKDGIFDTWTLTNINIRGNRGAQGPESYGKVEVNLGTGDRNHKDFRLPTYPGRITDEEICRVIFPGTDRGGVFNSVKLITRISGNVTSKLDVYLKDSSGNLIAEGSTTNNQVHILDLSIVGTFPAQEDYLILTFDARVSVSSRQRVFANFYYLSIS